MELSEVDTCGLLCFRSPVCTSSCLNARLQKAHADGVEYMRLVVHHIHLTQSLSIDTSFKILIDGLLKAVQDPKMLLYGLTYRQPELTPKICMAFRIVLTMFKT